MIDETYYTQIMKDYPYSVSKEQLRIICHISKRVAKYYLDNGIIPCENNGQATHKYTIATQDVITFLRRREEAPDLYRVSVPSGSKNVAKPVIAVAYSEHALAVYRELVTSLLSTYPDLMTIAMINEATGYSAKTIHLWKQAGHLRWLRDGMHYLTPKTCVIDYMMSEEFRKIAAKSRKHRWILQQLSDKMKEEMNHE